MDDEGIAEGQLLLHVKQTQHVDYGELKGAYGGGKAGRDADK